MKEPELRVKAGDPARQRLSESSEWSRKCFDNQIPWYLVGHARELLGCDPNRTLEIVERGRRLIPRSVWLSTVRARLIGTVPVAEEAVSLDGSHVSAQLALVSALVSDGKNGRALKLLRKIDRRSTPEVGALRARILLAKGDFKGALRAIDRAGFTRLGMDRFLPEATAGLRWPWTASQVAALAQAQLGNAKGAAMSLGGVPAGTLPELREAVATHSKAGERLMKALADLVADPRVEEPERDLLAAPLARLRVLAGEPDQAMEVLRGNPQRLGWFCPGLSELLWTAGLAKTPPSPMSAPAAERLRDLCRLNGPNAPPVTEPPECAIDATAALSDAPPNATVPPRPADSN